MECQKEFWSLLTWNFSLFFQVPQKCETCSDDRSMFGQNFGFGGVARTPDVGVSGGCRVVSTYDCVIEARLSDVYENYCTHFKPFYFEIHHCWVQIFFGLDCIPGYCDNHQRPVVVPDPADLGKRFTTLEWEAQQAMDQRIYTCPNIYSCIARMITNCHVWFYPSSIFYSVVHDGRCRILSKTTRVR